jgi:hypothetical protein
VGFTPPRPALQVKEMVPGILEANLPKWMEGISLDKFELGSTPPKITFINVDEVCCWSRVCGAVVLWWCALWSPCA